MIHSCVSPSGILTHFFPSRFASTCTGPNGVGTLPQTSFRLPKSGLENSEKEGYIIVNGRRTILIQNPAE